MSSPVLYSTNCYIKLHIQEKYRGDLHYVWCSEYFDPNSAPMYKTTARIPPSSSPCAIFKDLRDAVTGGDTHCNEIIRQRNSLLKLSAKWAKNGEISAAQRQDIVFYLTKSRDLTLWRPVIYVIPRVAVESRILAVPANKRAGLGNEWIIEKLVRDEFDTIELPP